jgi:hypothetical protein
MWAFLLFVSTYYLVHIRDHEIRRDGNGYIVTVDFHNNGSEIADCSAEEGHVTKRFTIGPYGDDKEEFRNVSELSDVRFGCEVDQ